MILTELYVVRKLLTESAYENEDIKTAMKQIDSLIQLVSNSPQSGNGANLPRVKIR